MVVGIDWIIFEVVWDYVAEVAVGDFGSCWLYR